MFGKVMKTILKMIFVTIILGFVAWLGKSLYDLWRNMKRA